MIPFTTKVSWERHVTEIHQDIHHNDRIHFCWRGFCEGETSHPACTALLLLRCLGDGSDHALRLVPLTESLAFSHRKASFSVILQASLKVRERPRVCHERLSQGSWQLRARRSAPSERRRGALIIILLIILLLILIPTTLIIIIIIIIIINNIIIIIIIPCAVFGPTPS